MGRRGDEPPSCWDRALRLLARQESSGRRLRRKLEQRNYDHEEIDETITRLLDYDYLDDRRYGRRWAEEKLRRGPMGRRRLRADLQSRGLDGHLASEIAGELLPDDDRETAQHAADLWQRRKGGDLRALARHLDRLGFSGASVGAVIAAVRESRDHPSAPASDRNRES